MTTWARVAIVSTLAVVAAAITARPAGAQALGYGIAGPAGYTGFFGNSSIADAACRGRRRDSWPAGGSAAAENSACSPTRTAACS